MPLIRVSEVSGLLSRLNMSTRQFHARVDDPWLELLRPTVSRADYLTQLVRTYGLVAPFESACKYTPRLRGILDLGLLNRAGLIAQDLLALGLSPAQVSSVPHCLSITTFSSATEALGWFYVIERSTLLQDGIRRHLLANLPEVHHACAYLTAYDGRVNEHWDSFGQLLERAGTDPELADEIIGAAHAGFDAAKDWFRVNGVERG